MDKGQRYAAKVGEIIPDSQLSRWGYELLNKTDLFELPCETWRNKPKSKRDWPDFDILFTKAEKDRSRRTSKELGYANTMPKEVMEGMIKQKVHKELTHLMCLEVGHNNQAPTSLHFTPVAVPSIEKTLPVVQKSNAVMTTKDVKRMVEKVLKDQPYCNTCGSKR